MSEPPESGCSFEITHAGLVWSSVKFAMGSQVLMEFLPVGNAGGRIASCADVSASSSSYSSSSIFGVQPRWCSERSHVAASGSVAAVVSIRSSSDPRRSMFGRRSATARPHLRVLMDPRLILRPFPKPTPNYFAFNEEQNVILAQ